MSYLIVFFGAGIGGVSRHAMNILVPRLITAEFPFATLIVNVLGCILMGVLTQYLALKGSVPEQWRLFLAVGVLGGFTTFSAFSLDAVLLYERGQLGAAAVYALGSVVMSIAGLLAGLALVRHLIAD